MNFKEAFRFAYGLMLGISMPYLKPTKRYLFPTKAIPIDDRFTVFLGGSAVCAVLVEGSRALVINVNQGVAAAALKKILSDKGMAGRETIILNSIVADFSAGLPLFADAEKIYVGPASDRTLRKELRDVSGDPLAKCESVLVEKRFEFGDETVVLIPVAGSATESDLVVFLEKRSVLFMGALFYNKIHPILRVGPALQPQTWIRNFSLLMERFKPKTVIPAEGDLASFEDAQKFLNYLKDLTDVGVEFSECRARYDWPEIPSYTSLEENFDLLRDKVKTHTTL